MLDGSPAVRELLELFGLVILLCINISLKPLLIKRVMPYLKRNMLA